MASSAALPTAPLPQHNARVLSGQHSGPLQFARFTRNGRYCITGGNDKTIVLWNPYRLASPSSPSSSSSSAPVSSGAAAGVALALKEFKGHGYEVSDAVVSGDNARIGSVGGDKCAFLFDIATGACVRKLFGHEQRLTCCDMNADGTVLFTGSNDKTVRCWDLRSASRTPIQTLEGFTDNVTRVVCAKDRIPGERGKLKDRDSGDIVASCLDGHLRRFDMRKGQAIDDDLLGGAKGGVTSFALSHDGNCVLASSFKDGGSLILLERDGGMQLKRYSGHTNALYRSTPAFTADDAHVVCGSEDGALLFWDLLTSQVVHRTAVAHKRVISWVEAHPDPDCPLLLTASFDGTAKLWCAKGADLSDPRFTLFDVGEADADGDDGGDTVTAGVGAGRRSEDPRFRDDDDE